MKKVLAYLPLHFAVLLILGILCQFYFKIWTLSIPFIILVFLLLIVVLLIRKKILEHLLVF
jgi:competence protein ComEC